MLKANYISQAEHDSCKAEPLKLNFHVADHKDGPAVYFRDMLRRYMMAKRPERANYPSWNYVKFHQDSILWETDPLFGWCNKNTKKDGSHYNVYADGLKVHTTIDYKVEMIPKFIRWGLLGYKKGQRLRPQGPRTAHGIQCRGNAPLQRKSQPAVRQQISVGDNGPGTGGQLDRKSVV